MLGHRKELMSVLSKKETELLDALEPRAASEGVEIVTVQVVGAKKAPTIRVFIDTPEGVSFDELGEAVRTANADTSTEAEQRQAAGTLARIEGTNLYDAVVENINGGLARVAELLKRNEAELAPAAVPVATADTGKEYGAFDMNEYL